MFKKYKKITHDWKKFPKKRWPYKGDIENSKYLKDRAELFRSSGNDLAPFNGLWIFVPNKIHKFDYNNKITKKRWREK